MEGRAGPCTTAIKAVLAEAGSGQRAGWGMRIGAEQRGGGLAAKPGGEGGRAGCGGNWEENVPESVPSTPGARGVESRPGLGGAWWSEPIGRGRPSKRAAIGLRASGGGDRWEGSSEPGTTTPGARGGPSRPPAGGPGAQSRSAGGSLAAHRPPGGARTTGDRAAQAAKPAAGAGGEEMLDQAAGRDRARATTKSRSGALWRGGCGISRPTTAASTKNL